MITVTTTMMMMMKEKLHTASGSGRPSHSKNVWMRT
jgi:hypothetical protein